VVEALPCRARCSPSLPEQRVRRSRRENRTRPGSCGLLGRPPHGRKPKSAHLPGQRWACKVLSPELGRVNAFSALPRPTLPPSERNSGASARPGAPRCQAASGDSTPDGASFQFDFELADPPQVSPNGTAALATQLSSCQSNGQCSSGVRREQRVVLHRRTVGSGVVFGYFLSGGLV
jgi:hypothetical protein